MLVMWITLCGMMLTRVCAPRIIVLPFDSSEFLAFLDKYVILGKEMEFGSDCNHVWDFHLQVRIPRCRVDHVCLGTQ